MARWRNRGPGFSCLCSWNSAVSGFIEGLKCCYPSSICCGACSSCQSQVSWCFSSWNSSVPSSIAGFQCCYCSITCCSACYLYQGQRSRQSVAVIDLSEFIQTVNGYTLYFPSTSMSMPMVTYVDNLHCIDLLTDEVSSVLQPCSLRSPYVGAISIYEQQIPSSSRIIIKMRCISGNVSYANKAANQQVPVAPKWHFAVHSVAVYPSPTVHPATGDESNT